VCFRFSFVSQLGERFSIHHGRREGFSRAWRRDGGRSSADARESRSGVQLRIECYGASDVAHETGAFLRVHADEGTVLSPETVTPATEAERECVICRMGQTKCGQLYI